MKKSIAFLLAMFMLVLAGCKSGSGKVVDYKIDVPEGFEEIDMEGLDACWYNADGSNINLAIVDKDATTDAGFALITADMLRTTLEQSLKDAYDVEAKLTDRYFNKDSVSGFDAYQYCYDLEMDGLAMSQLIVCINADQTYTFTFTDTDSWMSDFETSAAGIQLITE